MPSASKNTAATVGQSQQFCKKKKKTGQETVEIPASLQLSAPSEVMKNWLRSAGEGSRRYTSHSISTPGPHLTHQSDSHTD